MMNFPPYLSELPTLAVFDFDDTLTKSDTFLPFLRMVVGQKRFWWGMLMMSPFLIGYKLKLIPNWRAKEALLNHFLSGLTTEKLQWFGQRFALKYIPKLLRPEAVQRLRWHQKQQHLTILISASLEVYLLPWAKAMGFDGISGTQLTVQNGCITGKILGKNCYGQEKVRRLRELIEDLDRYCICAYGDSRGDRELLATVQYPFYRKFS